MDSPPRAADLNYGSPTLPYHSLTVEALAAYISCMVNAPHEEWCAVAILDDENHLITQPLVLYRGHHCPIAEHLDHEPLFAYAKQWREHRLYTMRYHPHPNAPMDAERYKRCNSLSLRAMAHGVRIYNHLTLDRTGRLISWRDWGQPGASGISLMNIPGMRFMTSIPVMALSISLMISM
jgi:hypothetical protein